MLNSPFCEGSFAETNRRPVRKYACSEKSTLPTALSFRTICLLWMFTHHSLNPSFMHRISIFVLSLLLCTLLRAQSDVQIKVYDFEDGLSHRIVSKILQDSTGFIWIATINGLNRFDGYEFVNYTPHTSTTYLPHESFSDMAIDPEQRLWLGSPNYITRFDPDKNTFEDYKIKEGDVRIREAVVPHDLTLGLGGQIWAAAYHEQTAATHLVLMQPDGEYQEVLELAGKHIGRPMIHGQRKLYLGAVGNELWELGAKGSVLQRHIVPVQESNRIVQIASSASLLYILCADGQLFTFDPAEGSFATHPASIRDAVANALTVEEDGSLWIGGRGILLYYDAKLGSVENFAPRIRAITKNTATYRQIFRDKSNVIWIASDFGAIRLVQSEQLFSHYLEGGSEYCSNIYCSTRGIAEDEKGNIYFSYYNSIHVLDPQTDGLRPLFPFNDYFNYPFGLTYFDGALYTGNGKRIDLNTLQVRDILKKPDKDLGHVIVAPDSTLWMGYMQWLYRYDPHSEDLTPFEDTAGRWDSLDGNISFLHLGASSNTLWVGTLDNGLHEIIPGRGRAAHYHTGKRSPVPFRSNQVNAIYESPDGRLWVGSGDGLYCLMPGRDSLRVYTTADGLANNFINGILPEGDSCLWISTDNGLSRLVFSEGTCTNYYLEDGLSANEFNRISSYRSKAGRLYFGGLNGINAFFPGPQFSAQQLDKQEAHLLLTHFSKYDVAEDTLIQRNYGLGPKTSIELSPWDRIFSFGFALADYRQPLDNTYSYKLEGFEEEWSPPGSSTMVRYNNIPAGSYTFRVRAKAGANSQSWSQEELAIPVLIHEAFYNTWWFWVLCTLLFGSAVFGVMRWRIILAHRREQELEALVKDRTKELEKEKQKSEELLLNILPEETAKELKEFGFAKAKRHELVTVMFSDFKGFSHISEGMDPEDLVAEIDHCFRAFDEIMEKYGLEKIKTVGDAYLAVGGMRDTDEDEAVRVTLAAMAIQEFMAGLKIQREAEGRTFFEARIGIHTGPVVAGIVGIKKFAYDIWGDTVNLAARMETNGEVGAVNVSEATYAFIRDYFRCTENGQYTETKGQNIDMYLVDAYIGD